MAYKLLIIFILLSTKAKAFDEKPIRCQLYGGAYNLVLNNNYLALNTGLNIMQDEGNFLFSLENYIHYSNRTYEWPGEGNYKFKRTVDVISISCGANLCRSNRINPFVGITLNNSFFIGKTETSNDHLRNYIIKSYDHRTNNLYLLLKLNIRISDEISAYVSHNLITLTKGEYTGLYGLGIAYNFYSKEYQKDVKSSIEYKSRTNK